MEYDIYFHNDFDGHASAAVIHSFLSSRGDDIEHYVPVDFHLEKQWLRRDFFEMHTLFKGKRNPAIVVDFPFHPRAAWWFDHHESPFKKEKWRLLYKPSKTIVLDPSYLSCCRLTYDSLKRNFKWKPPKHFTELVKWLDIIDGARYRSAWQTIEMKEPALAVDAFIDEMKGGAKESALIVRTLAKHPIKSIAAFPDARRIAARARRRNKEALAFYKKNLKLFGNTSFIDLRYFPDEFLRFAPYYLFPKIQYAIRFITKGSFYHVGIGENPWIKKRMKFHIGLLLKKYGGGGHKGAGAVDFPSRAKAEKAIPELIEILNRAK